MPLPPLLHYETEAEYRKHYRRVYCRGVIETHDGIRVYFQPQRFEHAFYEGRGKNRFSPVRAQRLDWIGATLSHPEAVLYQGWDNKGCRYVPERRVSVAYKDFVAVVELSLGRNEVLKGKFITCYQADNSIDKICRSPLWDRELCLKILRARYGR